MAVSTRADIGGVPLTPDSRRIVPVFDPGRWTERGGWSTFEHTFEYMEVTPMALASYNTPFHSTLQRIAEGIAVPPDELGSAYAGFVDTTVVPPLLTAQGKRLLEELGPYAPNPRRI